MRTGIVYTKLISKHLNKIKSLNYENGILVYKGFPIDFLMEINNIFAFLIEPEKFITKEKIDLKKISENINELISHVLTKGFGIHVLLYEQFFLLCKNINLSLFKGNIVLIENNLFQDYPNQSNIKHFDIEQKIDGNEIDFEENEIFNLFYVNSILVDDINFVQYHKFDPTEYTNVEIRNFFDDDIIKAEVNYREASPQQLPKSHIKFPASDNSYTKFKYDIFCNKPQINLPLVTDYKTLKDPELSKELRILNYVFTTNDLDLSILVKKNELLHEHRNKFLQILERYWNSDTFRNLIFYRDPDISTEKIDLSQGTVIEEIVRQCEKAKEFKSFNDIFLTAPTGAGKSVLFQIPAIYLAQEYQLVTIVISPLKALMYDQVTTLKKRSVRFCAYINSDISYIEREDIIERIKNGEISILYLSPELLLSYDLRTFIGDRQIGLLVIDEAHLVTTWGRDFRVDYWYLGNYIRKLRKYSNFFFPVLALTATAVYMGKNDIVFETIDSLNMQIPNLYIGNIRRDEISFNIREFKYQGNHESSKIERTKEEIIEYIDNNVKAIVYFPWTKQIEVLASLLPKEYKEKVGIFYGAVDKDVKQIAMEQFKTGEILVILATKAFGMGVDISDIKSIYHHSPSGNLSDYVQEIGRVARERTLKGLATLDFCVKDLKFTKILYGLSSIKQYQIKLALQKINDIYNYKRKPNHLISIEDFAFIFNEMVEDIETKVKSTLLLLEKDLFKRYGYNVIIIRPKSLYSVVFAQVPYEIESEFLKKYGKYCEIIEKLDITETIQYTNGNENLTRTRINKGNIYQIQLNAIWEKFYSDESFPKIKRKYFEKELFSEFDSEICPRFRLTIRLKHPKHQSLNMIQEYFTILEAALSELQNRYFKRRDLEKALKEYIKDRILRKRIVDLIINLYTSHHDLGNKKLDTFISSRINNGEEELRVINKAFIRVKHDVIRLFNRMFATDDSEFFNEYIAIKADYSKNYIKIAYLLESFILGNYELTGGQLPQLFIRINDPFKIQTLAKDDKYSNMILQDIDNRHKNSMIIMENFFNSQMNDEDRWNFIERYFLGQDV